MNQGGYFGQYQGGFQTLPKYAYEMMTAPTQQNAKTIGMVASGIGGIAQKYMDQSAANKAFEQGSAAQFKGLESTSQATGVPMNPVLSEQYKNMGQMNAQQQAAFQNSLGQEAQRIQTIYGINQKNRQMQSGDFSQGNAFQILTAPPFGGGSNASVGATTNMSSPNPFGGVSALPTASPASSVLPLSPGFGASLVPELSPEQIEALERAYMQMRRAGR
jgi:hypothetical protein